MLYTICAIGLSSHKHVREEAPSFPNPPANPRAFGFLGFCSRFSYISLSLTSLTWRVGEAEGGGGEDQGGQKSNTRRQSEQWFNQLEGDKVQSLPQGLDESPRKLQIALVVVLVVVYHDRGLN